MQVEQLLWFDVPALSLYKGVQQAQVRRPPLNWHNRQLHGEASHH
jgi:hypothetical protein